MRKAVEAAKPKRSRAKRPACLPHMQNLLLTFSLLLRIDCKGKKGKREKGKKGKREKGKKELLSMEIN
jgi:hypothetical protein